jgi:hypothetical protein
VSAMTIATGLYDWLLFGHIVAAMACVGGGLVLGALAIQVVRAGEPGAVARFAASFSAGRRATG